MSFHEVRFPTRLSFGAIGGPERRTEIVTLANGFEERNSPWSASRRRYDAGLGMQSLDDVADAISFFEARQGQLFGFRWKDWSDFKSCVPSGVPAFGDQELGLGDGVTSIFQLIKKYQSGPNTVEREISKPVQGTVVVAVNGAELISGADFIVDYETGLLTLNIPPVNGASVTAGFIYDVPVRFDIDRLDVSLSGFEAGDIPNIPVVELRLS
jgi:uncharacterized protein (TIGR02217 family)